MIITYADFIQTVSENRGEKLPTIGDKATFRAEANDKGVLFTPVKSGKSRTVNAEDLQVYLDVFNSSQSYKTTSYTKSMFNGSYVLAVIQFWEAQRQADGSSQDGTVVGRERLDEEISAPEGEMKVRLHRHRERSPELVKMAKRAFRIAHERLFCEVCTFDFGQAYGEPDFIEAHHRIPLRDLLPGTKTKLSDFVMVCANCHRMLHRGNPWPTVEGLKQRLQAAKAV